MKTFLLWLLNRLQERRTYIGLVWILGAAGVEMRPDVWDRIFAVTMALAGLLEVVFRETPRHAPTPTPVPDSPDPAAVAEWGQRFERLRHDVAAMPTQPCPDRDSPDSRSEPPGFGDR